MDLVAEFKKKDLCLGDTLDFTLNLLIRSEGFEG